MTQQISKQVRLDICLILNIIMISVAVGNSSATTKYHIKQKVFLFELW